MNKHIFLFFCFFFIFLTCYALAGNVEMTTYYPAPKAAYNTLELSTNYSASSDESCRYNNPYPDWHMVIEGDYGCCTALNRGSIFQSSIGQCGPLPYCEGDLIYGPVPDESPAQLNECSGWANSPSQWCNTSASYNSGVNEQWYNPSDVGMILTDPQGTLHACMYSLYQSTAPGAYYTPTYIDTSFPQQCYNTFCTFGSPTLPWVPGQQDLGGYGANTLNPGTSACADVTCAPGYEMIWLPNGVVNGINSGHENDPGYDLFQTSPTSYTESFACCPQSLVQATPFDGNCAGKTIGAGGGLGAAWIGTWGNNNPPSYFGAVVCGGGWTCPPDCYNHEVRCTPDYADFTYGWYDTGNPCPAPPTVTPTDQRW